MKEETVRSVFIKYLNNLGETPKLKKKNVPGPDIAIKGGAYECKGSKFDKNTLFKRVISDAFEFSRIGIVMPYNALSCFFVHQLEALELLIREDPHLERSIEIYIVAEENDTYFLYRWPSVRLLSLEINKVAYEHIPQYVKYIPEEKEARMLGFLKDLDDKMREHVRSIVIKEGRNPSSRWEGFSCTLE